MAVGAGPVLEEAAVFDRKFDHGAFVVDCRSFVDADGLLQAEAEQLHWFLLLEVVFQSLFVLLM